MYACSPQPEERNRDHWYTCRSRGDSCAMCSHKHVRERPWQCYNCCHWCEGTEIMVKINLPSQNSKCCKKYTIVPTSKRLRPSRHYGVTTFQDSPDGQEFPSGKSVHNPKKSLSWFPHDSVFLRDSQSCAYCILNSQTYLKEGRLVVSNWAAWSFVCIVLFHFLIFGTMQ